MLITFIRTIIVYIFVIFVIRLMGKRQIGELEPSEFVVTIIISEVAAMPIQESSQPLASSGVAILLLLIFEIILSFLAYKSPKVRKVLYGLPSILFAKGRINQREMERQRFNINDLMEIVRNNGGSGLSEVDFVIVETNGNVSVLMNAENKPLTPSDMGISPQAVEISYIIVDNGKINDKNLQLLGFNEEWLRKKLSENNTKTAEDVYFMSADRSGKLFIVKKEKENS